MPHSENQSPSRRRRALRDGAIERGLLPDALLRAGSIYGGWRREREAAQGGAEAQAERLRELIAWMSEGSLAEPVPAGALLRPELLGARRLHSSALWPAGVTTLDGAEEAMLTLACERSEVSDGQRILDLGCGWGALSLWLAERHPAAHVTALASSPRHRDFVEAERAARGLGNLQVLTDSLDRFAPTRRFDRVMAIDTFVGVRNWRELLGRIWSWLRPTGRAFVQVPAHRTLAYRIEETEPPITTELLPSHDLLPRFQEHLNLLSDWIVPGTHYARTLAAWTANLESRAPEVLAALQLEGLTPAQARARVSKRRLQLISARERWGYRGGNRWLVSQFLLEPRGIHSQPL